MSRPGTDLAHLLLSGFRSLTDQVAAELTERGYEEIRPVHGIALHALLAGADNVSELGRRMSVTKQAAAKTVAALQARHYVASKPDPADKRRARLYVTDHGRAMLCEGEAIFDKLRQGWAERVGEKRLAELEDILRQLVDVDSARMELPWGLPSTLDPQRGSHEVSSASAGDPGSSEVAGSSG
ncbi:DNA-binding MarR family transcriptional regulator [Streptomyces tendae]|uniref:MarR family winged helix-turn-helix transcriptional regulator n=1 Tax=Streptomyces tendae TaxID=1932 RepID=UPI003837DD71